MDINYLVKELMYYLLNYYGVGFLDMDLSIILIIFEQRKILVSIEIIKSLIFKLVTFSNR